MNLGVCLDTAHAFTAGYDIRDEDGLAAALDSLDANVGLENVRAVHFNDSKADYNSRVDRHWHIGQGHIGAEALRRVASHPRLAHAAFLLETPADETCDDACNLAALRSFVRPRHAGDRLMDIQLKDRAEGAPLPANPPAGRNAHPRQTARPRRPLPSPASLATKLSIDKGEVQRAYFELEHAGLVTKNTGKDFLGKEKTTYTVK